MKNKSDNIVCLATILIAIVLGLWSNATASRLPDSLQFGDIFYKKQSEQLYIDEAKFIIINESEDYDYVMASLFKDHVRFFDSTGNTIKTDSLPGEPRFYFSKTGRWLFLWGDYDDQNNYYRLYGPGGKVLFEKISTPKSYESAYGIPLEKSLRFLKPGYPEVKLSLFDKKGNPLGGVSPLGTGIVGKTYFAADLNEHNIYVTVTLDTASVFIHYNSNLVEQYRTIFPGKGVIALRTSYNGRFILVRIIDEYKHQPMFVTDQNALSLFMIEYPHIVKFSKDESLLAFSQIDKKVIVVDTATWNTIIAPDISAETDWSDINFSGDSRYLAAFDGAKIVLVDIKSRSWYAAPFPFAFFEAALINNADNLVFTGDFGWVMYKRIR